MLSVPAYSLLLFAVAVPLPVPLDLAAALAAGGSLEVFTVCWATTLQVRHVRRKDLIPRETGAA